MSTTTSHQPALAAPTTGADLSLTQLHLMRAGYLLMVVGLALKKWPLLPDAHTMPLYEGVTLCILVAMSLLAFLGLRYPVKLLPVLLFESAWKLLWLGLVALPKAIDGNLDKATSDIAFNCSFVVLILAVIPWRYVWRTYVRAERRPVAMSTPTPHTDVDLRLPDEDTTKDSANAATRQSAEAAGNPLDAISWPVRTDRLTLRPATRDDLEATWRFRRLDDVSRWLTRAPATLEEYRTSFEDTASLAKTLIIELDGQVIGDLMLADRGRVGPGRGRRPGTGRTRRPRLGAAPRPRRPRLRHRGRPRAPPAQLRRARPASRHGELLRRQHRLMAAMERVGMRRETYAVKESLHRSGEWLDTMGYALLAEEWSSRRPSGLTCRTDGSADPFHAQDGAGAEYARTRRPPRTARRSCRRRPPGSPARPRVLPRTAAPRQCSSRPDPSRRWQGPGARRRPVPGPRRCTGRTRARRWPCRPRSR